MTLFNKCKYLPESVDSILAQNHSNFGLIAIDNASTDNTENIMNNYGYYNIGKFFYEASSNK